MHYKIVNCSIFQQNITEEIAWVESGTFKHSWKILKLNVSWTLARHLQNPLNTPCKFYIQTFTNTSQTHSRHFWQTSKLSLYTQQMLCTHLENPLNNLGEWAIASHGRGTRPSGKLVSIITVGDKSIAPNLHHM